VRARKKTRRPQDFIAEAPRWRPAISSSMSITASAASSA
jgi:hypothetical protein